MTEVYLRGKIKWFVRDEKFQCWSCRLWPDAASYEKILDLKNGQKAIKNELRKDDDGYYMQFRRPFIIERNGKKVALLPPKVAWEDGRTFDWPNSQVGNNSEVTIKLDVYSHSTPAGGRNSGKAARLDGIIVHNLVEYVPNTITEEQYIEENKPLTDAPKTFKPPF